MKNIIYILSLLIVMLLNYKAGATHNRGGILTYLHISGTTYEATITTYTVQSSPASTVELELFWGDGTSDTIPLLSSDLVADNVLKNIYIKQHTYSSEGTYLLHVENPNRNAGILNIPNSINTHFYIESELITSAQNPSNNSAQFSAVPIFNFTANTFNLNSCFYDPDDDVLTYELVSAKGLNGEVVLGYTIPQGVTLDPVSGELRWENPNQIGSFVFTIKVSECRNGGLVGSVLLDVEYTVNSLQDDVVFGDLSLWQIDNEGNYFITVEPNDSIGFWLSVTNATELVAFGEAFIAPGNAVFYAVTLPETEKLFYWQPSTARCAPYVTVFRGIGDYTKDLTLLIYVREQGMEYCDTVCNGVLPVKEYETDNSFILYPNPASEITYLNYYLPYDAHVTIEVFDLFGKRILLLDNADRQGGNYKVELNTAALSAGTYVCRMIVDEEVITKKLVVVN